MKRAWRAALAAAAVGLLTLGAAARADGTVVVAKDFPALCADADLIFVGTVAAVEPRWVDAERRSIETLVTFDDLSWLKGEPQRSVTLRFAGGTLDGLRIEVAGTPRFAVGDRRVIFAYDGKFVSPIVGFDQGALPVVDGPSGPVVEAGGTSLRAGGSAGALRLGAPSQDSPVPLDEFLDRVRVQLEDAAAP